jgi:hypothetical protein
MLCFVYFFPLYAIDQVFIVAALCQWNESSAVFLSVDSLADSCDTIIGSANGSTTESRGIVSAQADRPSIPGSKNTMEAETEPATLWALANT